MKNSVVIRILCLLLSALLLLPFLAACGGEDGKESGESQTEESSKKEKTSIEETDDEPEDPIDPDETDDESEDEEDSSDPEEESEDPDDEGGDVGYRDLKGYVYKAYVRSYKTENVFWGCEDFWTDEENVGRNILASAVYARNSEIETNCNCKILQIDSEGSQYDHMVQANVGGNTYELAIVRTVDARQLAVDGILLDLAQQPALNLGADYYDQNQIRDMSLGGALYFISGDMNISTIDTATATIFNQDFLEKHLSDTFRNPYEMVKDGTWTLSKMIEMANLVTVNTTGGKLDATLGDTLGYFEYEYSPLFHFYASGERITVNDEDGYPQFLIGRGNVRASDVFDQIFEKLNVYQNPNIINGYNAKRLENYQTGNVLFTDLRLLEIRTDYRPLGLNYGIVPLPKYNEEQEDYYSVIYFENYVHLWMIPVVHQNLDKATYMMELMAKKSHEEGGTMDAYYINTMELNAAKDSQARDMLRMIRQRLVYDIALLYEWGNFATFLTGVDNASANTFSSQTNLKNIEAAEEQMAITIDKFKEASFR